MIKKTFAALMVCALAAGTLITGCDRQKTDRQITESQPVVKGEKNGVLNHGHSITGERVGGWPDAIS